MIKYKSLELFAGAGGLALGIEKAGFNTIGLVPFENVKGLFSHDKGKTYQTINNTFIDCGYKTYVKILNAWDYNVPQKRERLFIIWIRNDLNEKVNFEFPKPNENKPVLNDILLDVPISEGYKYSKYKEKIFSLVPAGGCWKNIYENIAKEYMKNSWYSGCGRTGVLRRLSLDEPSLTILTSPQQKQTDRCHPIEVRPFTIRESARCQTFPDEWIFCGSLSQQYKQIGNAVPVNMAYAVAKEIKHNLDNLYKLDNS